MNKKRINQHQIENKSFFLINNVNNYIYRMSCYSYKFYYGDSKVGTGQCLEKDSGDESKSLCELLLSNSLNHHIDVYNKYYTRGVLNVPKLQLMFNNDPVIKRLSEMHNNDSLRNRIFVDTSNKIVYRLFNKTMESIIPSFTKHVLIPTMRNPSSYRLVNNINVPLRPIRNLHLPLSPIIPYRKRVIMSPFGNYIGGSSEWPIQIKSVIDPYQLNILGSDVKIIPFPKVKTVFDSTNTSHEITYFYAQEIYKDRTKKDHHFVFAKKELPLNDKKLCENLKSAIREDPIPVQSD